MTDSMYASHSGLTQFLERAVFVLALAAFSLLTIIDGARSPVLHLWFVAGFFVLLGLQLAVRGLSIFDLDWAAILSMSAMLTLIGIVLMQLFSFGPFITVDPLSSWQTMYLYLGYLAAFLLFRLLLCNPGRVLIVGALITAIALLQTLFGMINASGSEPVLGWAPTHYAFLRVTGTYVNRNFYASLVAMSSGFLLAWILVRPAPSLKGRGRFSLMLKPGLMRGVVTLMVLVLICGIMLSGSRSALVGFGVAILLLLILVAADPTLRPGGWGMLVLGTCGAVLFVSSLVGRRFSVLHVDMSDRLEQWKATLAMIPERWLTGFGAGSYENVFRSRQTGSLGPLSYTHAHNDYLETVMETGVIGVAILTTMVIPIMFGGFRKMLASRSITRKRGILGALFGVVVMLVHGMLDFPFQVPANTWLFVVLLAMLSSLTTIDFRRFAAVKKGPG